MRPRSLAVEIHRRFSALPGSEHIATCSAIEGLVRWIRRARPRHVLELGAGIGTLTQATVTALLELHGAGGFTLTTLEDHPFCREALRRNLAADWAHLRLLRGVDELPDDLASPELLITDGGDPADDRPFRRLARHATVFIEGDRRPQAAALEAALGGRPWAEADVRVLRRRPRADPDGRRPWDGGYRVYRLDPTLGDRVLCGALRARTAAVYRARRWFG